jgi:uncharacterized protein (TIGR00251 family)
MPSATAGAAPRLIDIRVVPRARRNEVGGDRGGRLLVRTTAPPVDDQANEAVRRLLAEHFDVPLGAVEIVRGSTGRDKTIRIGR